jgi:hypothetical protein
MGTRKLLARRYGGKDANGCGGGLPQFLAKFLNSCRQQLKMNLPVSGIHVAEVAWRENNGFFVEGLIGRHRSAGRGKNTASASPACTRYARSVARSQLANAGPR